VSLLDRVKRKYYFFKHKRRKIDIVKNNNQNFIKLKEKIENINKNIPLGTSSWENNRKEIRRAILEDNIMDFINWNVIQKTMFFEAPRTEYEDVLKNEQLIKAIGESQIGNPKSYFLDSTTSGNLIHHAYSISQMLKRCNLDSFDKIIEFGGGYGSMCRLFRNMKYSGKYVIFDLPEFLALQEYYIGSINTKYLNNTIFTGDMHSLKDNESNSLFIATWSFSEMPLELREDLLKYLNFSFCIIAFQSEFDGIDNIKYFTEFKNKYPEIEFKINPIDHLNGHYYLIGTKK